ncbi:MAG TPA: hypothetical protein PKA00_16790 [Saprospiraceae bacterium]|nr:hypothetical protein [Saprospiraceae bacterium]HMQ84575.1 hypothetical protein [Saprospiraceae bacterium]
MRSNQLHTFISAMFLFATISMSAQGVEKTLVQSFNLQGNKSVELDVKLPVEVQTWDSDILRVQMNIEMKNGSEGLLKSLVTARRYNLEYKVENGNFIIYAPSIDREVKIGGQPIQENITLVVFLPEDVALDTKEEGDGEQATSSMR